MENDKKYLIDTKEFGLITETIKNIMFLNLSKQQRNIISYDETNKLCDSIERSIQHMYNYLKSNPLVEIRQSDSKQKRLKFSMNKMKKIILSGMLVSFFYFVNRFISERPSHVALGALASLPIAHQFLLSPVPSSTTIQIEEKTFQTHRQASQFVYDVTIKNTRIIDDIITQQVHEYEQKMKAYSKCSLPHPKTKTGIIRQCIRYRIESHHDFWFACKFKQFRVTASI